MSNCTRMFHRNQTRMKAAAVLLDNTVRQRPKGGDGEYDRRYVGMSKAITRELRTMMSRRSTPHYGRRIKGSKNRAKKFR